MKRRSVCHASVLKAESQAQAREKVVNRELKESYEKSSLKFIEQKNEKSREKYRIQKRKERHHKHLLQYLPKEWIKKTKLLPRMSQI